MDKSHTNAGALIIVIVLLLAPILYAGGYVALVKTPTPVFAAATKQTGTSASYGAGGEIIALLFWPLEQVDRRLRPEVWELPLCEMR